ncbi:MAG: hypothetical protein ACXAHE_03900 [Roseburia sp. 1XD42-69]|jgi:hypothetical protein
MKNEKFKNIHRRKSSHSTETIIIAHIPDVYIYPRYCQQEQLNRRSCHRADVAGNVPFWIRPSGIPWPVGMVAVKVFTREMAEDPQKTYPVYPDVPALGRRRVPAPFRPVAVQCEKRKGHGHFVSEWAGKKY